MSNIREIRGVQGVRMGRGIAPASGGSTLSPDIQAKLAGWWKEETDDYISDQLGYQDRASLTQNSLAGQIFPGRAIEFAGATDMAYKADNGALDIGSNSAFSIALWVKFVSVANFDRFLGKTVNGVTNGEWYFLTGSNTCSFGVRGTGGLSQSLILSPITTGVWYQIVATVDSSQKITTYLNKAAVGTTPTISGTLPAIDNAYGFGINCKRSQPSNPAGYSGTNQYRDIRIFKGKVLSSSEIASHYDGKFVSGFTEWWPMAGNYASLIHSAKNGGLHLTAQGLDSGSVKTGVWESLFNDFGYAEDATYGLIPPDMSTVTTDGDLPINDVYGNPLVFAGKAKLNLEKVDASTFKMPGSFDNDQIRSLRNGANLISLNTWFSGTTAQNIAIANVAQYCGARQFYNSTTKELLIIKEGEYLTSSQELALISYTGAAIPTSYDTITSAYIARFTNSYSDAVKQKLDNFIRLLDGNSAFDADIAYELTLGSEDEGILNILSSSHELTKTADAGMLIHKGMFAKNGYYETNYNPSTDAVNLTQNAASLIFKLAIPMEWGGYLTPFYAVNGSSKIVVQFDQIAASWRINVGLNNNGLASFNIGTSDFDPSKTFVITRTGTTLKLAHKGAIYTTTASTSTALVNDNLQIGYNYIPNVNYLQYFQVGAYMSDSVATLAQRIIDMYFDDKLYRADEWEVEDDFEYKLSSRLILDRIGDQILWSDGFYLYYSIDNGVTISSSIAFNTATYGYFAMAHIFDDGKIIVACYGNVAYKTTTALTSVSVCDFLDVDDSPYVIHTPANAAYPGEYFRFIGINQKQYLDDDTEIFVWNPIGNNLSGVNPALVLYSFGDNIKVAYEFGQNTKWRDDGTNDGSTTTGTLLGDAGNSNVTRHGHGVSQNGASKNDFYSMWGDLDYSGPVYECQFMKHIYDQGTDSWTHEIIKKDSRFTRFKSSAGQMPGDGNFYWSADTDDATPLASSTEKGFHFGPIDSLADTGTHTQFYKPLQDRPVNMFHLDSDGFFMCSGYSVGGAGGGGGGAFGSANIIYSFDLVTFYEVPLNIPGNVYSPKLTKIAPGRYEMTLISDYDYLKNGATVELRFPSLMV